MTRGTPLFTIDPVPFRLELERARAQEAEAQAQLPIDQAQLDYLRSEADAASASARLSTANLSRDVPLGRTGAVSAQTLDASRAAQAESERASALFVQAQLNLEYTTIVSPVSGVVGQRSVQPGQNVSPGQQLMTIVPLDSQNIWVTANFKETQLRHMRSGQPAKISVDTYGRTYDGHILNIAAATGALYSLLPPENATGNYVKVVQRIPVKIVFDKGQDPQHLLRPGMSVEPNVRVR